jgi:hypothetical protein
MSTLGTAQVLVKEVPEFPRAGVAYAARELARRAGVSAETFNTWRVESDSKDFASLFVEPGTQKQIRFSRSTPEFWKQIRAGVFRTSRARWMRDPGARFVGVNDFVIPFSSLDRDDAGCLFSIINEDCVECPVDLLASIALTLGRYEETLPGPRDQHGRFPVRGSMATRDDFLRRPIVDEFGLAFEQALEYLLPQWKPAVRQMRVKVSHDVDEIGLPFTLRGAAGHAVRRGHPLWTARDLVALTMGVEPAYQKLLREIVAFSIERGIKPAVYWKASGPGPNDTGYELRHAAIQRMIKDFRTQGVEMGIHPGYETFASPEKLSDEVLALQQFFGDRALGGRQDYLRWNPQTWVQWESLGLAYDSSVGFTDGLGFRAGTCYPFRPWLFSEGREAKILEIPLIAMDDSVEMQEKVQIGNAVAATNDIMERCRMVGGVFTLVWHNTRIIEPGARRMYQELLDLIAGHESYDWKTDPYGSAHAS